MRGSMIEALRSHHIRTARALGLSDFSVVVQACAARRAAAHRLLCRPGRGGAAHRLDHRRDDLPIPGVGRYFVEAALNRDYTLVMGTVVVIAIFTIVFNLIVDLLYAVVDPRVRYD